MYIRSASSPSSVLWAFHTIQPSSFCLVPCGRLSRLYTSFWANVNTVQLHRIVSYRTIYVLCVECGRVKQAISFTRPHKARSTILYDTIRCNCTVLTFAQKLTSSQLNLPHGTKQKRVINKFKTTGMWANAQRDGCPAEYRWCSLFNAAKFA